MDQLLGDWIVLSGRRDNPVRVITLRDDGKVTSFHGNEVSWHRAENCLVLMGVDRSVVSIFDFSCSAEGIVPGKIEQLDFADTPIWITRKPPVKIPRPPQFYPNSYGPLGNRVNDPDGFINAWNKDEDFSVVLMDGCTLHARAASMHSRNLGTSQNSIRVLDFMQREAPNGYYCMPVFLSVLNDCYVIDGTTVVTRDGFVLNETTELTGPTYVHLSDIDFALQGSKTFPLQAMVAVVGSAPTASISAPTLLFSTLRQSFGHWLIQCVPNWVQYDWIRKASKQIADSLLIGITCGTRLESFRNECLELLELKNPVLRLPKGVVHYKRLVVPTFLRSMSRHWPGMNAAHRKMVETARRLTNTADLPTRIHSSRGGQGRGFSNHEKIESILDKHQFTPIIGGTIPLAQQVASYANAEAMFGAFGSNMNNMVFCEPGSHVIDVIDEYYEEPFWEYFLANATQLDYTLLITAVRDQDRSIGFFDRRLHLDEHILDETLTSVLRS